jgi:hypothetical protein
MVSTGETLGSPWSPLAIRLPYGGRLEKGVGSSNLRGVNDGKGREGDGRASGR